MTAGTWRPLLEGALAARARELVDMLADRLRDTAPTAGLDGAAGRALLFAALGDAGAVDAQLDAAFAGIEGLRAGLHAGLAGVAFVLAHLGHEVDASVDEGLAGTLGPDGHHDLIGGAAGLGLYALEHGPASEPLLAQVIAWLDAHTTRAPVGRYLFSSPAWTGPQTRARHPEGVIDLGAAHGQAGAIALAGAAAGGGVPGARALYEDLLAYLWSQALAAGDARFAALAGEAAPTRSAWCYGDPGIAAALWAGASAAGDDATRTRALELARLAARRAPAATLATEAHLCHGAVGLAHLYNRLAQAAGDDELAAAACSWYARAVELAMPERGELLDGQLGIALALHAATSGDEPAWDRVLAAS